MHVFMHQKEYGGSQDHWCYRRAISCVDFLVNKHSRLLWMQRGNIIVLFSDYPLKQTESVFQYGFA